MTLLAMQRDFRTWLTTESPEAAARLGRPGAAGPAVYLNNYRAQLMACLAESYPMLQRWLGDAGFAAAAAEHIDRVTPHSWTLDAYGADFAATLDALYPDDREVGELAALEWALAVAFVGADAEPVAASALADVDWDRAVLTFAPTHACLPMASNAAVIWSALANDEPPPAAALLAEPAVVAVWRAELAPTFRILAPAEATGMRMVADGASFGALCERLVADHGDDAGPQLAGAMLGQWLADGLISAVREDAPIA